MFDQPFGLACVILESLLDMGLVLERGYSRSLRQPGNREGGAHALHMRHQFRRTDTIANPHSRQAVHLRKSTEHHQLAPLLYPLDGAGIIDASEPRKVLGEIVI